PRLQNARRKVISLSRDMSGRTSARFGARDAHSWCRTRRYCEARQHDAGGGQFVARRRPQRWFHGRLAPAGTPQPPGARWNSAARGGPVDLARRGGGSVKLPRVPFRVGSRSPYPEDVVRALFGGAYDVEVVVVPPPPSPDALRQAVTDADLVLADKRHRHRLDKTLLSTMRRCRLIQQPAVGFDVIDHRAAAELRIPVANAAGYNRDAV